MFPRAEGAREPAPCTVRIYGRIASQALLGSSPWLVVQGQLHMQNLLPKLESQPLWESRRPPLNCILTPSACLPKCTKASLTMGEKWLNTSFFFFFNMKLKFIRQSGVGGITLKKWCRKTLITLKTEVFKRLDIKTNIIIF